MNSSSDQSAHTNNTEKPSTGEYQKILIAVDYLPVTEEIFKQGVAIAKKYNSQLMIFHCVYGKIPGTHEFINTANFSIYDGIFSNDIVMLSEQIMEEAMAEMNKWLKSLADQALAQGICAEFQYQTGFPGERICHQAQEWGADLIILGRRGMRGLSELLLGSVSNYVLHHAPCSILVLQH